MRAEDYRENKTAGLMASFPGSRPGMPPLSRLFYQAVIRQESGGDQAVILGGLHRQTSAVRPAAGKLAKQIKSPNAEKPCILVCFRVEFALLCALTVRYCTAVVKLVRSR